MLRTLGSLVLVVAIYALYYYFAQLKKKRPASTSAPAEIGDPEQRANLVRVLGPDWGPLYDTAARGDVLALAEAMSAARGQWARYSRICTLASYAPFKTVESYAKWQKGPEVQLIAADAYDKQGWRIRGHGSGSSVSESASASFQEWQERARDTLLEVTQMDPSNPTPWAHLVAAHRNLDSSDEEKLRAAREALARYPDHFGAVRTLLDGFAPHWHEDEEAGLRLARDLARGAPDGSLVAGCVIQAYVGKWHHAYYFGKGDAAFAAVLRQPDVQQEISTAYQRAAGHAENEWSPGWLSDAAVLLARAGLRELAASAFQRLGERHIDGNPWTYISKTAKLRGSACFAALRDWACSGNKHPCKDVESS
jgi:hypothetical protein